MDLIRFKVTGSVQGVSFRYYTQREATHLGLRGWVHNHPDDSVEGVAVGAPEAIAKFKTFLWRGSPHASVKNVQFVQEIKSASAEEVEKAVESKEGFLVTRYRKR